MQAEGAESGTVMPIHRFVAAVIRELPLALYRVPEGRGIDRRSDAGTVLVAVPTPTDSLLSGEQFHELKVSNGTVAGAHERPLIGIRVFSLARRSGPVVTGCFRCTAVAQIRGSGDCNGAHCCPSWRVCQRQQWVDSVSSAS